MALLGHTSLSAHLTVFRAVFLFTRCWLIEFLHVQQWRLSILTTDSFSYLFVLFCSESSGDSSPNCGVKRGFCKVQIHNMWPAVHLCFEFTFASMVWMFVSSLYVADFSHWNISYSSQSSTNIMLQQGKKGVKAHDRKLWIVVTKGLHLSAAARCQWSESDTATRT